jgi:hypothetical protein
MDSVSLVSVLVGLGLSAACGFRVFVPLLVMSLAARGGYLPLSPDFAWIATTPALAAFGVATLLEVGAYYVPLVDNALDLVATPTAVVAGVVVSASVVTDVDPFLRWSLALIAGGGVAGAVQALTTGARLGSMLGTGGLTNPLVSTAEAGGSVLLSVLAIVLPLMVVPVIAIVAVALLLGRRRLHRRAAA